MDLSIKERDAYMGDLAEQSEDDNTVSSDFIAKPRKRKLVDDEDVETERKRLNANHQERARMRKINKALEDLRNVLPREFSLYHRRMSKIRTLRMAMHYIKSLSDMIIQDNLRRHELYSQAFQSMACPDMVNMSSDVAQGDNKFPYNMSPYTAMVPVYPYLTPICMGFDPALPPYQTPDQSQTRRNANPRHLNFGSTPHLPESTPRRPCNKGYIETPTKKPSCREIKSQSLGSWRKGIKSETITSPLLGSRNPTELDASFLSTNSEGPQDEVTEIPPLQTNGQIIPTGRTLADILKDSDES